ncbi:WecB/TagA/CpsF family glycosyltransferase [Pseudidiomarina homiensis]|uniref:WecB/TagA/CpsF family glycosyltransferase n=1 Tax=Pseudidiomarina homiensis TaxID=364198 RepID=UPI00215AF6D7|nr:WecB/TagA/CpsF family glycosyltransferase [Pseudidiomarina homiensis]
MSKNEVMVGGIAVRPFKSINEAVDCVINGGDILQGSAIAINPEKVMLAKTDEELRSAIDTSVLRYADGIGVVRTIRRKGFSNVRIPGCDLWQALMVKSAELEIPVMLIGAKPEVSQEVVSRLKDLGVSVVYACDGYSFDENEVIDALVNHKPKIISIALGSPKQERLIYRLQQAYPEAFYQGVGGTFDVYVGAVKRAPTWACAMHLEWLYRLCCQPRRILRQRNLVKYLVADLSGKL